MCSSLLSIISSRRADHDGLFVVYESNGGELILESAKGVILIPQCSNVREITLVETKNCYKNIPIHTFL